MTDHVSRETSRGDVAQAPPAPESARGVFGVERIELAQAFADLLATEGVVRGLIGPRETPRLWDRHLLNSGVLQEMLLAGRTVCDIGSGAGLPGLAVAIARPDLQVTLVEPLLRRTTFLTEVVDELGLDNVEVVRGRADDLHGRRAFDHVTSRAVAPLDRLLRWSMPLVAPHGALVAMKGSSIEAEIAAASDVIAEFRCAPPEIHTVGIGSVDPPTTVVRVAWADPARIGWPLTSSRPAKKRKPAKGARTSGRGRGRRS